MTPGFVERLHAAAGLARRELLRARHEHGHWTGELSASALSTATAVTALAVAAKHPTLVTAGLDWLATHQNPDGGWGDTTLSLSNLSTTALVWAAFGGATPSKGKHQEAIQKAEQWLSGHVGASDVDPSRSLNREKGSAGKGHPSRNPAARTVDPNRLAKAVIARYGTDRTFSVPILTMCALSGRLGAGRAAWRQVIPLPFELAVLPHRFFATLRLPVVSYALPALIAIGQARFHHRPPRNPFAWLARRLSRGRTLKVLTRLQPPSGGFLEATPLTSFVVMSLAGSGQADHPVVRRGIGFLVESMRPDGSWPIDTNLATWVTTLAINALAAGPDGPAAEWSPDARDRVRRWLLEQQYREVHPYTSAAPGGWAWTNLSGGVPDADDTPGALLALRNLGELTSEARVAASRGCQWLLDLQNADGGIPTFCRGWTNLPFDRSSPDLTAHTLRAWVAWRDELPPPLRGRVNRGLASAVRYLIRAQRASGEWLPLWFGNQHFPADENPVYGTAKVLLALAELTADEHPTLPLRLAQGARLLTRLQRPDDAWGGDPEGAASIEETALAVEALAALSARSEWSVVAREVRGSLERGTAWLIARVESGDWTQPSPIGFYFAKLWYFERLYPLIFTTAALNRAASVFASPAPGEPS